MKKLELALLLGLAASICCSSLAKTADSRSKLEENVLRLHVLANSDSIDDQALKLKVRDKVLAYAGELLTHPGESLEAVEEIIHAMLEELGNLPRMHQHTGCGSVLRKARLCTTPQRMGRSRDAAYAPKDRRRDEMRVRSHAA